MSIATFTHKVDTTRMTEKESSGIKSQKNRIDIIQMIMFGNEVKHRDLILDLNRFRKRYIGRGIQKAVGKATTFKETKQPRIF